MSRICRQVLSLTMLFGAFGSIAAQAASSQLPKVEDVLERLLERAKIEGRNDREFKKRYAFTGSKITEQRTGKGKLKEREVKRIVYNPKPPVTPVSQKVLAPEDRQDAHAPAKELHQDASGEVKGRAFEHSDFPVTADLLKRFQFTLAGREAVNGRPALRIDFKPASGDLPVRSLRDRFINKAAGRVWVDADQFALVKVDLHLTEPVNVIGGLVGAVRRCNYRFQRERTPEGLWFTKHVNWHLEGRQLFTSKIIEYDETRENVRKVW